MPGLRSASRSEGLSAKRWDALILGSGVSALVCASRVAATGRRVLVLEEDRAQNAFPGLREPFFLAGARDRGGVDACLRELALPLIDRRRIEDQHLALQVVASDMRLDVGEAELSAHELIAWGLAKPDAAKSLVRALVEAAEAERRAMLASPVVRVGRRTNRPPPGTQGSHVRGLPAEAASPPEATRVALDAEIRALSNLATAVPGPEARARLLGSLLAGGAGFASGRPWLVGLLRQRARSLHVEFATVSGVFEFAENGDELGVLTAKGQLLLGRMLILGAASTAIANTLPPEGRPEFLDADRVARRRLSIHFSCKPTVLPEGMADRVVLAPEPGNPDGLGPVMLALHRDPGAATIDLVARAVLPIDPRSSGAPASESPVLTPFEDRLEARVRELLRFGGSKLARRSFLRPIWDDDDWLEDPPPGHGWPAEIELRASVKLPVYRLDRCGVAGLGLEGDLLLGWRGGDALAAEF